MLDNKLFWQGNMVGAVGGWIFAFYGLIYPIDSFFVKILWLIVLLGWGIGHSIELKQSLPIAKEAGVPLGTAIVKTLVFGLTWWVPLKRGVFAQ